MFSQIKIFHNFIYFIFILFSCNAFAQSWSQSVLSFSGTGNVNGGVTSLMFGPDNRLYVAEYTGAIKIFTIQRNGPTEYVATHVEILDGIRTMPDHNDDGTPYSSLNRETLGLTVVGTSTNPVIYVTSSDYRIGAGEGGGNGDINLDTNSGVITRFSWNGSAWDVVDIVRGLPRSEENHATNGLEFVTINGTDYLIVAQGGHTNGGSPSTNFVYSCEYALSAAILAVNLTALESMPILDDNGRAYIYDLPTLDDPTRPNVHADGSPASEDPDDPNYSPLDINDPWGGNDGLNQAMVVLGGPVQILSPGYRNAYDLVVTESGALYVTDNGANGGWGGLPMNEGGGSVTNDYDPNEPGSSDSLLYGERVNNLDHLQLVTTNLQTYAFGSLPQTYYGGHPNPTRANPVGAGLYTADGINNIFRTLTYDPDGSTPGSTSNPNEALPANWPPLPVSEANTVEGDWRGPGMINPDGPDDNPVVTWGTNTNGIDEYTASNFGGALQGNLLAGTHNGLVRRIKLNEDGTLAPGGLTSDFLSGIGGNALGITCNSDFDIFPGTVWVGTLNRRIVVFEPTDFLNCLDPNNPLYDANADYDSDGYSNQDEEDNGTEICNGGSQPDDWDKVMGGQLISDLNDPDDDFDGIPDALDPFQLGDPTVGGSDAFTIPILNDFFNDQQNLGGIYGLGLTGLMNNGDTGANWLLWLDRREDPNDPNPNDVLGGAPGLMTSHMTSGTALGISNNQEKGYQYGVQVQNDSGIITVAGGMVGFNGPLTLYENLSAPLGELGFFIGDGTQSNYIKFVVTTTGFVALQEIDDVPQSPITYNLLPANRPSSGIKFFFEIDPSNGQVILKFQIDGGLLTTLGTIEAEGTILQAIQSSSTDLAVGLIGSSNQVGVELEGTWDFLNVTSEKPYIVQNIPNLQRESGAPDDIFDLNDYFDDNNGTANLTYNLELNTNPNILASISNNMLTIAYPSELQTADITIRASDLNGYFVENTFTVSIISSSLILARVNAGGVTVSAADDGPNWEQNNTAGVTSGSSYSVNTGTIYNGGLLNINRHISIPDYIDESTYNAIFAYERYDVAANPEMEFTFPLVNGEYQVNLYMGNSFEGTSEIGDRIFDIEIEGVIVEDNMDLIARFGHQSGGMVTFPVAVSDGVLNIKFLHQVENPLLNAIEIMAASPQYPSITVNPITDQANLIGDVISTLGVSASGGNPNNNFTYAISGQPLGIDIEPTNGLIYGTIDPTACTGGENNDGVHSVTVTVEKIGATSVIINFSWIVNDLGWFDKNENENYTARHECSFVQAGDKFYLLGGRENSRTLDVYNYTSNSWNSLVDSAPMEFNHFQATEYQGLIWVIGAFKTNAFPNETPADFIWVFDPVAQQWIQGPEIPSGRRRGSAGLVVHNDKFYIVGGNTIGHNGGYVPWFDEYDPVSGIWTTLTDAPRSRDHFHAAVIDNKLYAASGRLSGGPGGTFAPVIAEVDVYNFSTNSWSSLPSEQNLPTPRAAAIVANFENKLVIAGGEVSTNANALDITEIYDPLNQSWSTGASLIHPRHGTQGIVSGNGIFVVAGSPVMGGGKQKNMEFYGSDSPLGLPLEASELIGPNAVDFSVQNNQDITLDLENGNTGIFIRSMEITGPDADDFVIQSGNLNNVLLKSNSSKIISVQFIGSGVQKNASLTINYGAAASIDIPLSYDSTLSSKDKGDKTSNAFNIYPNPSSEYVYVEIKSSSIDVTDFMLFDITGRLIKKIKNNNPEQSTFRTQIDVRGLQSGLYNLYLLSKGSAIHKARLVINN
ncbi:Kelch repeat-containing protein [Confluentibacter citreus]|uniref:Kelch repeat-containing protein n=1 Tax=Confluentibacter citreus TaxID=2007307 RepID=UPI0012FDABE5|nr:malectin domain-containing carbohydrate-binding protein [Confluentibacter citreus]